MTSLADWVGVALWETLPDALFSSCAEHLANDLKADKENPVYLSRDSSVVKLTCVQYLLDHENLTNEQVLQVLLRGQYEPNPRLGSYLHNSKKASWEVTILSTRPETLQPGEVDGLHRVLARCCRQTQGVEAGDMFLSLYYAHTSDPAAVLDRAFWDDVWQIVEWHVDFETGLLEEAGVYLGLDDDIRVHVDFQIAGAGSAEEARSRFLALSLDKQRELLITYSQYRLSSEDLRLDADLFEDLLTSFESI